MTLNRILTGGRRARLTAQYVLLLIVGVLLLKGCVVVPTALPEEKPFRKFIKEQLSNGNADRETIEAALGPPRLAEDSWTIHSDVHAGWGLAGCTDYGCGKGRITTPYHLRVEFDADNQVKSYDLLKESELCKKYRFCFYRNHFLMRVAPDTAKGVGVEHQEDTGECHIYIYLKNYLLDPEDVIEVEVNGVPLGPLVNTDAYLLTAVSAGDVVISAAAYFALSNKVDNPQMRVIKQLGCAGQESIFLQYETYSGFWSNTRRLQAVSESTGRSAINDRWRAVAE